jgi:iron complex outermembrane receptor protein
VNLELYQGRRSPIAWSVYLAILSLAPGANAQEGGGGQPVASRTLEEIVVTARRRDETAQTVPISIGAFGPEELERRSVDSLEDLTRITPGLRFAAEGGAQNTTISLRGLSKIPIGGGTPAVVTYFSDVPMPSTGTNLPTFDLASIQVLKGPQGTLFGRNTIGGAVLVTPEAPSYDAGGYIGATVGEYNYRVVEGALNLPIVDDKVALRIAGQSRQRDGFTKNIGVGPDPDDLDQYALRASLLIEPSEYVRNTLIVDYFKADEAPAATPQYATAPQALAAFDQAFGGLPVFAAFQEDLVNQFAAQQARGIRRVNLDAPGQTNERELWGVTNRTEVDISDSLTLRNILGYRSTEVLYHSDIDGGPTLTTETPFNIQPLLNTPFPVLLDRLVLLNPGQMTNREQFSNEIQLLGSSFDESLEWIFGAFYLNEEPSGKQDAFYHQFDPYSSTTGIHLSPPAAGVSHTTTESRSVFGQIGLDLSDSVADGLTLNLGYRYTWDDVEVCGGNIAGGGAFTTRDAPFLTLSQCEDLGKLSTSNGIGTLSTETSAATWTVGLDYQITSDLFSYVTMRRGYRSGGLNTPVFETPCTTSVCGPGVGADLTGFQEIDAEEVTDIEVGLKANWAIGETVGHFNIALYDMEYVDAVQFINVSGVIPPTDPAFPTQGSIGLNAADVTVRGMEMDLSLSPAHALTFTVSTAYADQSVGEVSSLPAPFALTKDQVSLPTPEWSGTLGFNWLLPFTPMNGELRFSGDYFWTQKWQAQGAELPSYEVSNFRLDWADIGRRPLKLSLFVTNAFDEEYVLSPSVALAAFPFNSGIFGPPRMFGAEIVYRFGD